MMKNTMKANYLAEGQWKCSKSPTGAHHWVVVSRSMTCKHCAQIRENGTLKVGAAATSTIPKTAVPGLDLDPTLSN